MRFLALILMLPVGAWAGALYRCQDPASGQTAIQDMPCPSTAITRSIQPTRDLSAREIEQSRQEEHRRAQQLIERQRGYRAETDQARITGVEPSRCEKLRAYRDRWCARNDSLGRQRCQDSLYNYNKSCR